MERLEISWSKFITVVVEEVVVDPTVAGFALLRALESKKMQNQSPLKMGTFSKLVLLFYSRRLFDSG